MADETMDFAQAEALQPDTIGEGDDAQSGYSISATTNANGGIPEVPDVDIDVFDLGELTGTHQINVLPDWARISIAGAFTEALAETSFFHVQVYEEHYTVWSNGTQGPAEFDSVAELATESDSILASLYPDDTFSEAPTFKSIEFDFHGPRDGPETPGPYTGSYHEHYTGHYFLRIESFYYPKFDLGPVGSYDYSLRYAVGLDLSTGLRAHLWGDGWVNLATLSVSPPPPPPPEPYSTLPPEAALEVVIDAPTDVEVESRPWHYDAPGDQWSLPATDTQPAVDLGDQGKGAGAFAVEIGKQVVDTLTDFAKRAAQDAIGGVLGGTYKAVYDSLSRVNDVRTTVGNFFTNHLNLLDEGIKSVGTGDLDAKTWFQRADAQEIEFHQELATTAADQLMPDETRSALEKFVDNVALWLKHSDPSAGAHLQLDATLYQVDLPNGHTNALIGTDADETVIGGDLADLVYGATGDDTIYGNDGNDVLGGGGGYDLLVGGEGGDRLYGGDDNDELYGGTSSTFLAQPGDGDDEIYGDAGNDLLRGGDGDDALYGGEGNDNLRGDAGSDIMDGGAGHDFASIAFLALGSGIDLDLSGFDPTVQAQLADPLGGTDTFVSIEHIGVTGTDFDDRLVGSAFASSAGGGYANQLTGGDGNDQLVGADDIDRLDGGFGNDTLEGRAGDDDMFGRAGDDYLDGGAGDDFLNAGSGTDALHGGSGSDAVFFGAAFDASDSADGGDGFDQIGLQGDYSGGLTIGAGGLLNIEQLVLLPGNDTRFGDTAGNHYSYNLTTVDANVAAGQVLYVSFNTLRAGENVTFNGSAETDGSFITYAGLGNDTIVGSQQSDGFFFGNGKWGSSDSVDGQGGALDQLGLQGNYTAAGSGAIVFGASQLSGIVAIVCITGGDARFGAPDGAGYSYDLTMNDGNVGAGQTLYISANTLKAANGAALLVDETLTFNGSAETDGMFVIYSGFGADHLTGGAGGDTIYGGGGADEMTGGAGNDLFAYISADHSTAGAMDQILDFATGDRIDLSRIDTIPGGADEGFAFIGAAAFSHVAGQLRAFQQTSGHWQVEGDVDGDGTADLVIAVTTDHALGIGDFVL